MYEVIYRLLELAALVLCSHSLSGEKVKLDIYNVGFVSIELAFMQMIQDEILSKQMYFAIYLIYWIYLYVKFQNTIKRTSLIFILVTLLMVSLQMIVYVPVSFLDSVISNESIIILIINAIIFAFLLWSNKNIRFRNILDFCGNKDWILRGCLLLCVAIMVYCMYSIKTSNVIESDVFVLISLYMTIISIFVYRWQKSIYEVARKEREIQITNLYNDVFKELIETTRKRQHDFNNHIDALYGMHITAGTMDELISMQNEYCKRIKHENRYSKVLNCINNSTLSGFLYTKFVRAEECGIDIDYELVYTGKTSISVYDIIEIIGILMDNAVEALIESNIVKKIVFELKDYNGICLCVRNPVENITNKDIEKFFINGFTTKEFGSGIGLCKLKDYQKKYKFDIFVQLIEEFENKWIEFKIVEDI